MTATAPQNRYELLREREARRDARVVHGLTWAALTFLILIAIKSWVSAHILHAQILLSFAVFTLLILKRYHAHANYRQLVGGLLTMVVALFMYLIASGGESNTGPLWFYVLPPLTFYLTNIKAGTAMSLLCIAFACVVFRLPDLPFVTARYDPDFQLRFLVTISFETLVCLVLDNSRRRARLALTELANLYERAAGTDELTGLSNRRDMLQQINQAFARYERSGSHFSVMLIDLDHFKRINDVYGHDAGDYVLSQFAQIMRDLCRKSDVAARWGGEEFLLLLPDTSLLQALSLAERLRASVENAAFEHKGQKIPVTLSAGVGSITQFESVEKLLKQADIFLYEAKMGGRNQIVPRVRKQAVTDLAEA
ncbi:MAG: GGDEF domain-containing protein [Gammaproteobacteria bacterium]|nr:GGDEF domain-containing protein [Gammaproteobacteria bacterium]